MCLARRILSVAGFSDLPPSSSCPHPCQPWLKPLHPRPKTTTSRSLGEWSAPPTDEPTLLRLSSRCRVTLSSAPKAPAKVLVRCSCALLWSSPCYSHRLSIIPCYYLQDHLTSESLLNSIVSPAGDPLSSLFAHADATPDSGTPLTSDLVGKFAHVGLGYVAKVSSA